MKTLTLLLVLSATLCAQSIYIGGGPSFYTQSEPKLAGNLTIGICTAESGLCSLTSIEGRGTADNPRNLVYSTQTGLSKRVATVSTSAIKAQLITLGQAGASVSDSATSGIVGMGGGVLISPLKYPNWSVGLVMRAVYSPNNPGWQPWGGVHIGYTFRSK